MMWWWVWGQGWRGLSRECWFVERGEGCVCDPMVRNFHILTWEWSEGREEVDHWSFRGHM